MGLGAAGRARRPVPAARGVRRAGVRVPDRRRRLPVEPPARWAAPTAGSAAGSRSARTPSRTRRSPTSARRGRWRCSGSSRRPNAIVVDRRCVLVVVCALVGALGHRRARPRGHGWASPPRSSRRSGSGSRCCSSSASRTCRSSPTRSAPRRCPAARSAAGLLAALAVGGWVFIGFDACVGGVGGDARRRAARAAGDLDRAAERRRARDPQRRRRHARAPRPGGGRRRRGRRPGRRPRSSTSFGVVVGEAVRRGRARRVPRLRHGGPGADRARRCTRSRATACCPRRGFLRRVDRRRVADRRDRRHRGRRVPRAAARAATRRRSAA